jgi:uncharacterized protein (UPF0276 family)
MIQLGTNLSDPLQELLAQDEALVDAVEVGPWFGVCQVRAYRRALPDIPFTFHGGDLIERVGFVPGTLRCLRAYQRACHSRWVSVHMTMWLPGQVWLMLRYGLRMPRPDLERASRRLVWQVTRLSRALGVPVLLENMPTLPFRGYEFESEPGRIGRVLETTGCGLVLDIGHARIAAAARDMQTEAYVSRLPLDRVVQVHVSGPRLWQGRLVDAHESLQEEDYELLAFVLARTRPEMVTLEYIRERETLHQQLSRLRELLGARGHRGGVDCLEAAGNRGDGGASVGHPGRGQGLDRERRK